jgi:hypothetical protein
MLNKYLYNIFESSMLLLKSTTQVCAFSDPKIPLALVAGHVQHGLSGLETMGFSFQCPKRTNKKTVVAQNTSYQYTYNPHYRMYNQYNYSHL